MAKKAKAARARNNAAIAKPQPISASVVGEMSQHDISLLLSFIEGDGKTIPEASGWAAEFTSAMQGQCPWRASLAAYQVGLIVGQHRGCDKGAREADRKIRQAVNRAARLIASFSPVLIAHKKITTARSNARKANASQRHSEIRDYVKSRLMDRGSSSSPSLTEIRGDAAAKFECSPATVLRATAKAVAQ